MLVGSVRRRRRSSTLRWYTDNTSSSLGGATPASKGQFLSLRNETAVARCADSRETVCVVCRARSRLASGTDLVAAFHVERCCLVYAFVLRDQTRAIGTQGIRVFDCCDSSGFRDRLFT